MLNSIAYNEEVDAVGASARIDLVSGRELLQQPRGRTVVDADRQLLLPYRAGSHNYSTVHVFA